MDQGHQFVLVAAPDARPYVRMVTERLFATLAGAEPCRDRARRADQVAGHDLMRLVPPETILVVFLLFCRIGGCLMLMPGFSSSRVPVQVRLFIAVAVTLALTPLLLPTVNTAVPVSDLAAPKVMLLIFSETLIGVLIGVIGRLFYMALQFMATAAAQFAGFNPVARCAGRGCRAGSGPSRFHHADGHGAAVRDRPALGGAARAAGILCRASHHRASGRRLRARQGGRRLFQHLHPRPADQQSRSSSMR